MGQGVLARTRNNRAERKGTPVGINCCLTMQQIDELVTWFTPRCRVCRQDTRPGWPVGDD